MDSFYTSYLQLHVIRRNSSLQPDPASAVGSRISPAALRQFHRAQAIQLAFFASGSQEPQVGMSMTHVSSSPTIELVILSINGASIRTPPDAIGLYAAQEGRSSTLNLSDGRWDIVSFLRSGRARVTANVVDIRHEIGGRSITCRIEFDSTTVPFLMPELADFSCPISLE